MTVEEIHRWVQDIKHEAAANPTQVLEPQNLMYACDKTFGDIKVKELVYQELYIYFCIGSDGNSTMVN